MERRNSYLISVSMRNYLIAAVVSMLIQNLNTIIDGILMGHFLGTETFSAINLCLPMIGVIATIGMLLYGGATTLASLALGAREEKKAREIYTVALISVLIVSVIFGALTMVGLDGITAAVCQEETLAGFVKKYLLVCFLGCPITLVSAALLSFCSISGKPKLVTISSAVNILTNIVCDIIYVPVLGIGIEGAALATLTGGVLSMVIIVMDGKISGSALKLTKIEGGFGQIFKENIRYGLPITTQSIAVVIYSYVCTFCSQKFGGVNGAFVGSLLTQITSLCQAVTGGVDKSFTAIGGMLIGQKDYKGMNILFKKGMTLSIVFSAVFAGLIMIFVPQFAAMMGATDPALISYSTASIRMALPFVVPISIVWIIPSVYVIADKLSIVPIASILQPVFVAIGLFSCGIILGDDKMWLGYPISAVAILLVLVILSEKERKKSKEPRSFFSLLPNEQAGRNVYDISVPCNRESFIETIRESNKFFDEQKIDNKISTRVRLCVEEVMGNIIQYAKKGNKSQYIDLKIVANKDGIYAIIRDDGKPFNPLTVEEKGLGLKILEGLCPKLDYQYSYGQNMIFMTWENE